MCDFKVGDEVVCVDARARPGRVWFKDVPVAGQVYTVVRVSFFDGEPVVGLSEIKNEHIGSTCYAASRFRKVQRRNLTEWLSSSVGNTDKIDKRKRVNA